MIASTLAFGSCGGENPQGSAEKAGAAMGKAIDQATEQSGQATEKAGDALKEAGEKMKENKKINSWPRLTNDA